MGLHNSGVDLLELRDPERGWVPFAEAFLTEGLEYPVRYAGDSVRCTIAGIPLPFQQEEGYLYGTFPAPFQSGPLVIDLGEEEIRTHVYPDSRKMTEQQFDLMLKDILEEAGACFQMSGLDKNVDVSGKSRDISWTQWNYIAESFHHLKRMFSKMEERPFRQLKKDTVMMRREKVKRVDQKTLHWLDRNGHGDKIPKAVQTSRTFETVDTYENRVVKKHLADLIRLLGKYEKMEEVSEEVARYKHMARRWMARSFLQDVGDLTGAVSITQKFRKQPVYRFWYKWFDELYKHAHQGIGFDYPIPLKDTFALYEMWCFMKLVGILREEGMIEDTRELFKLKRVGFFLDLEENKESRIPLKNGMSLYFQRNYQYNSSPFHTYTQRMIPDIVLEGESELIVFDPKYRVAGNLGTALGEMHKYRDGILHRESGNRAVESVFILTPGEEEGQRYFNEDFHSCYDMGAIQVSPGNSVESLRKLLWKSSINN